MSDLAKNLAGKFIVIDGPDGAGKTTQQKLLAQWLRDAGMRVVETQDPGGTAIGDNIRRILLDGKHSEMAVATELMLYMASRAQLAEEVIRPALARGDCVLCDRWVSATIAYQGAGGADAGQIQTVAAVAVGELAKPDLTLLLDLPAETGLQRKGKDAAPDRMEAKDIEFHRRVRELFLAQAEQYPQRFAVIDASANSEEVRQRLISAVEHGRPGHA
ncbi:MAG: dTMP kinase [Phycisphaerae bacterium]